jgi:hypothetical protein
VQIRGKIGNFKIAKHRNNRNTSSGGVQHRALPKAGLLLSLRGVRFLAILRCSICLRVYEISRGYPGAGGAALCMQGGPDPAKPDAVYYRSIIESPPYR